jgi:hypothetical protein
MHTSRIHRSVAILALCCGLARPGYSAGSRDSTSGLRAAAWALPKDAFGEFLRESRTLEDSLHYRQGEKAFDQEDFDSALAYHLAIAIPAVGGFRDDLLAQRSRIFARIWPSGASALSREEGPVPGTDPHRPGFEWSAGAGHSRRLERTGPAFPEGENGSGEESSEWHSRALARGNWPVEFGKQDLDLSLSASVDRSGMGNASEYETSLAAELRDGILAHLSLSLSTGLRRSTGWGSYRYHGLSASKAWRFESNGADIETGYSREWEGKWEQFTDDAWAKGSRGITLAGGGNIQVSLNAEISRPEYRFSVSPGLSYGFPLTGGLQALAATGYFLDVYPSVPMPPEYGKTRRVDDRANLDFSLGKELPHGYFISMEYSAEFGWTNLPKTAPAVFRPWQWSLGLEISRASSW